MINLQNMVLNSCFYNDKDFSDSLKFIANKYVKDDMPQQIICKDLNACIIECYKLFLNNELHSIEIQDCKGNCSSTDALNHFSDSKDKITQDIKIDNLEKELQTYKDFVEKYGAEETFKEFKNMNKNTLHLRG